MTPIINDDHTDHLEKEGWVIIRGVFSRAETEDFRRRAYTSDAEKLGKRDLLSNPHFSELILDERVLAVAATLVKSRPVYFGDSSYQIASTLGGISLGFHKDNPHMLDPASPDWQSPYTLVRFGIYLQDHARHAQGLMVKSGSHRFADFTSGQSVTMPTEPGDIVAWYLTTTHSGNTMRTRVLGYPIFPDTLASRVYFKLERLAKVRNLFMQQAERDRVALFMTFGAQDHHLENYLSYLKGRKYMVSMWQESSYGEAELRAAERKPVSLLSMRDSVLELDAETLI